MADDIREGLQWMKDGDLSELSSLLTHFDPITWQATNPQYHLCVYKLNEA